MKYLLLITLILGQITCAICQEHQQSGEECLYVDLDNIFESILLDNSALRPIDETSFFIPKQENLGCITVKYQERTFAIFPEESQSIKLPGVEAYTARIDDIQYASIIYTKDEGKGIYFSFENEELAIYFDENDESSYSLVKNKIDNSLKCGNHTDEILDQIDNNGYPSNNENNECDYYEYVLSVGVACDTRFIELFAGHSISMAKHLMEGRFEGVAIRYGTCEMKIIAELVDIVVEPCRDCYFDVPKCLPFTDDVRALDYNEEFAGSYHRPWGDVITLFTGWDLHLACVTDVGGLANLIGGACQAPPHNQNRHSNILEGNSSDRLWTHEIGHNLGVGFNHGNIPTGFFYSGSGGNSDGDWHYKTINTIHSTIESKTCIDKIEYCCEKFDDVFLCEEQKIWCKNLKTKKCQGRFQAQVNNSSLRMNKYSVCGALGQHQKSQTVKVIQNSYLGCKFNETFFRVVDCTDSKPIFPIPPPIFAFLCRYDYSPKCFEPDCVKSWEIEPNPCIRVITSGNKICISLVPDQPEKIGIVLKVKPKYHCGGEGPWYTWILRITECDAESKVSNDPIVQRRNNVSSNPQEQDLKLNKVEIYPNPVDQLLNIQSEEIIDNVFIINTNGELVKSYDCENSSCQLDMSTLPPSVYFVRIQNQDKLLIKTERIIIQH